ncbi:MAG: FAD-dependent oxidoreductase [Oscillospiraceae bacterium]|nr:FAD-dependent oxidoreductase [Oscillospiraceae bacterium]
MHRYEHLLSPITIGNITLKNRLLNSKCVSSDAMEPELSGPFYEHLARNGAALVCIGVGALPDCEGNYSRMASCHMDDPKSRRQYEEIVKRVHAHGSLATASMMAIEPQNVMISAVPDWNAIPMTGDYSANLFEKPEISPERLEGMIQDFVNASVYYKDMGFDGVTIYASYRGSILACSLSPWFNKRTDKYGGHTMEARATLTLEVFRRIKEACGQDFLIECQISATEEGGYTLEDWLRYCKLCEGLVDIFQIRGWDGSFTHVNSHNLDKFSPYNLQFAAAAKKEGIKCLFSPVGGFRDPDVIEKAIAEGKTDCVSMARAFISDEHYIDKIQAGRGEDLIPCLLCNGCHGSFCAVNPYAGYHHMLDQMFTPTGIKKKVAILGGGPAGLRAALFASQQGHTVTLYEKSDQLGGQLKFSDHVSFKWNLKDYKDWLIRQVEASDVTVYLGTEATPELLRNRGYDVILAAMGSTANRIPVKGAEDPKVWLAEDVFGHESELGENVVVIGGSATGREAALYLAKAGHKTTMVTRGDAMLFDDPHSKRATELDYENEPNFSYIDNAVTTEITPTSVTLDVTLDVPKFEGDFGMMFMMMEHKEAPSVMPDSRPEGFPPRAEPFDPHAAFEAENDKGGEGPGGPGGSGGPGGPPPMPQVDKSRLPHEIRRLTCDNVVISGGRTSVDASAYQGIAKEFVTIGDCFYVDGIRNCTNTAFAAVMQL